MKKNIHPKYREIKAICSCGNFMKIYSTAYKDLNLDICSSCHPFYTGKQNMIKKDGRIDRFNKKFRILSDKK